jgi:hypothetical protein
MGAQASKSGKPIEFTVGAGATYGNLVGGDFDGSKAAAGFDANAGVVVRRWQLGIGYDRTNHGHEDTDGDYVISNVYFESRLLFTSVSHRWSPYADVRIGRASATYEGVLGITDKAHGYIAGIGAGLLWPIVGGVQADAAAHYDRLSHDYGTGGYADAEKGGRASVRAGIRIATNR